MHAKQVERFLTLRLITSALLILGVITEVHGRLTEEPKDNFVVEGATAEFTCCSDVQKPLFWKVNSFGSQITADIYDISGLINGFRDSRFSVTNGSSLGCCRLTIKGVKLENVGMYTCIDNEGLGQRLSAELVVLESFDCEELNRKAEYMGENDFGLPQDVISVVCISKYFGNIRPKPICEWSSETKLPDNYHRVTERNLTTALNVQMPARKEINGKQISCYVKIDGEASDNKTPVAWKSSQLIINYASLHQKEVPQCTVNDLSLECHPPCDYKMLRFSNGSFYCEIAYASQTSRKISVLLQDTSPTNLHAPVESKAQSSGILSLVTAVLVTILFCGTVGGITFVIIRRKKMCQKRNVDIPEMIALYPRDNRGGDTLSRPGIVINMGNVYGVQNNIATTRQGTRPRLEEFHHENMESSTQNSEPESVTIRGVAVLGENLFFAYRNSSQVKVYSSGTIGYQRSWELKELNEIEDMTACSKQYCLYMSNITAAGGECEIFKVTPHGRLLKRWETGSNFGRLSVTHDFNILLAVHHNRKLVEYKTDGTLVRQIQLPDAIRPISALKVNSNDYYVSHGFGEDPVHGVSQVDANGEVLKRFGDTKGSTNEQLDTPVHLAMNDGSIWVADSQNGRVVVLSPTLEYQETMLSKEEDALSCPLRICIDQDNRRLILSDFQNQNHFLRVFNFN